MSRLILASTSRYRRELLARLDLPFDVERPAVEETARPGEAPAGLAARLAAEKAADVADRHPDSWVLGSDQVAEIDGDALGKPGSEAVAIEQLRRMSGREVHFHTAVSLRRGETAHAASVVTIVRLRALDNAEIERYVRAERPLDCAGSFKVEGLGISLFDEIESQDPTALVGLPLIATARLLRRAGFAVP